MIHTKSVAITGVLLVSLMTAGVAAPHPMAHAHTVSTANVTPGTIECAAVSALWHQRLLPLVHTPPGVPASAYTDAVVALDKTLDGNTDNYSNRAEDDAMLVLGEYEMTVKSPDACRYALQLIHDINALLRTCGTVDA